jgi:hypothetical protein
MSLDGQASQNGLLRGVLVIEVEHVAVADRRLLEPCE